MEKKQIIKPPILYKETQKLISQIEKKTKVKILSYWNSIDGSIRQNHVNAFYEIIKNWEMQDVIYLLIKSSGGNGESSLRIVNLLRQHTKKLIAIVSGECASAATMLALGADEIQMGPLSFLTAVDTSLTHDLSPVDKDNDLVSVSQDELSRVIKLWNKEKGEQNPYSSLYQYIHPLVFGAVDRASSLSMKICMDILSFHLKDAKKAEEISRKLNYDYPSHGYPITLREARAIGLNVKELDRDLNDLLFDLHYSYSKMCREACTDYDENNYHNNEIRNIIEAEGCQVYYQVDKDWHYRAEERRWIPLNDNSNWYKIEGDKAKLEPVILQFR